jgi:hypothetical protein
MRKTRASLSQRKAKMKTLKTAHLVDPLMTARKKGVRLMVPAQSLPSRLKPKGISSS